MTNILESHAASVCAILQERTLKATTVDSMYKPPGFGRVAHLVKAELPLLLARIAKIEALAAAGDGPGFYSEAKDEMYFVREAERAAAAAAAKSELCATLAAANVCITAAECDAAIEIIQLQVAQGFLHADKEHTLRALAGAAAVALGLECNTRNKNFSSTALTTALRKIKAAL